MSRYAFAAMLLVSAGLAAAQNLPPEVLNLARAMNTNRDLLKGLPLYTCLETIERSRPKSRGQSSTRDVVQVDVGAGETQEMFSWPGDTSFSSQDLVDLVGHGMLSTGIFSSFAGNLFVRRNGLVRLEGNGIVQGRPALHFVYTVPSLNNRWHIDWQGKTGELGEAGEFWVDVEDFHLVRLQVSAIDIPPQMLLRSLAVIVDYQLVRNGQTQALVPENAMVNAVEINGKVYHNNVAFHIAMCSRLNPESRQIAPMPRLFSLTTKSRWACCHPA